MSATETHQGVVGPIRDRVMAGVGPLIVIALLAWMSTWTLAGTSVFGDVVWVTVTSGLRCLLWFAAAMGYGWWLMRLLLPRSDTPLSIAIGLGIATMLLLDASAGAIGALQWGGGVGAWVIIALGAGSLVLPLGRIAKRDVSLLPLPPAAAWLAAPAVAVGVIAACSAPGWLWASEFGGYDAMSYHLQLSKEWLDAGRITGLEHNVYSFLPSYFEAAYYHLAILMGDGIESAYAAQQLHLLMTIIAAALTGRLAARLTSHRGAAVVAGILVLGTPWVVVVGSLAYNEMAVAALTATALLILFQREPLTTRDGVALGLLLATACMVKLTAVGLVTAPLGVLVAARLVRQRRLTPLVAVLATGTAACLPWIVRNGLQTGNPVFPFMTGIFGTAHWTEAQSLRFSHGHDPRSGLGGMAGEVWAQLGRYGLGVSPYPDNEPWAPHFSILPWLTLACLLVSLSLASIRRHAATLGFLIVTSLLFWAFATHIKSRFMVPTIVPAAVLIAMTLCTVASPLHHRRGVIVAAVIAGGLWSLQPLWTFSREPFTNGGRDNDDAPASLVGAISLLTGDGLDLGDEEVARQAASSVPVVLNHLLPRGSRILLIGDAAPFYDRGEVVYSTVWDRGPLHRAVEKDPDDPAAWAESLRNAGFSHLLIEPTMLLNWDDKGWSDPALHADRVKDFATRHALLIREFPGGQLLYDLSPAG